MCDERREEIKHSLRSQFEQTLEARVDRYLATNHQGIVGDHHFALASTECNDLFRDGYFTSCIMVTQAVSDGIVSFVGDRNQRSRKEKETKQAFAARLRLLSARFLPFSLPLEAGLFRSSRCTGM